MADAPDVLTAPYVLEYTYRRSTGPILGAFFTGLRDQKILGVRDSEGGVLVPPVEADPRTGADLTEMVEVGQQGVVETWTWIATPRKAHPLQHAFAWAVIRLDGASRGFLHAVDAGTPDRMRTGMRVRAKWKAERTGSVLDIASFEPVGAA
jgi:uncharacterized OB-fold protein